MQKMGQLRMGDDTEIKHLSDAPKKTRRISPIKSAKNIMNENRIKDWIKIKA